MALSQAAAIRLQTLKNAAIAIMNANNTEEKNAALALLKQIGLVPPGYVPYEA